MNINYVRNPNCECSKFPDLDTVTDLKERMSLKAYWHKGYIQENYESRECNCHKIYRLGGRYDRIADAAGLPSYEELSNLKYLGSGDSYAKLKSLPAIVSEHFIKDLLVFVTGPLGCQKTTSLAKLMYTLIVQGETVEYVNFANLIEAYVAKSDMLEIVADADWLIVDDCFVGETVNFKTAYTQFYNFLLKRRKPTIVATELSREQLLENKNLPSYNPEMLTKVFAKIDKNKSTLEFLDNVDKELIGTKNIDIWSL